MKIQRFRAFSTTPSGGNPAAVVTGNPALSETQMQDMAAEIGYSETAFVTARPEAGSYHVRYFAPRTEIPFCGHATVAAAVAIASDNPLCDRIVFHTRAGEVPIDIRADRGTVVAEITTVAPQVRSVSDRDLADALTALRLTVNDLAPDVPPVLANAGAWHLILGLERRDTLRALAYDYDALAAVSTSLGIATTQLFWRESETVYHSRNPFPAGGVYEDPATGAAAAALGAYLRNLCWHTGDDGFTVIQGEDMGRRSEIQVRYIAGDPRVRVCGTAVPVE